MLYKNLADILASKLNLSREEVDAFCDSLSFVVAEAASDMDSVSLPGFGSFEPRKRSEKESYNPSTGVRLLIPPKLVLSFRPSAVLRKKVRGFDGLAEENSFEIYDEDAPADDYDMADDEFESENGEEVVS